MNSGDTAWVLTAGALVLLMTIPGLAFFYGGLVRRKNVLSILMQCFIIVCVISLQWVLFGYSLAFGPDFHGIIGTLEWAGLAGVGAAPNSNYAATIPHSVFMIFQAMFAIITPALITGAFAERMKFSAFILFTVFWSILVYVPVCHWVWGGGWLGTMGALDFAGGTVIHINSGVAALAAALIIGRRRGFGQEPFYPNNITLTMLGAGLLWFGWFGFNAGSAVAANGVAGLAFFNTHVATAAAALSWIVFEQVVRKKPTSLGFASGAVAGLVAITPGAGFVTPVPALAIGFVAGMLCYFAILAKEKLGYDDSLDVVGVHGVGGLWGALATGLFASVGGTGLFYGDPHQFLVQLAGAMAVIVFSFVATSLVLLAIRKFNGLRVDEEDEEQGLDQSIHGETGYYLR
jgi:Amt family ammonium transporter